MAHIDAGKTTTTERILYYTGVNYKMGEVHDGAATMDWMEQEQGARDHDHLRGYDLLLEGPPHQHHRHTGPRGFHGRGRALAACPRWRGRGVLWSVGGVEPQSETVWRQADRYGVPRIAFVNKMDRVGADYTALLEMIRERLGANPIAIQLPIGEADGFRGVVDLVREKALVWDGTELGATFHEEPIPDELQSDASRSSREGDRGGERTWMTT